MSVKVMGAVWELDLPANEQSVLLALADHADHEGYNVRPSNGLTAWKLGISDDTVIRLKKRLVKRGLLVPVAVGPKGVKEYRIDLSKGIKKKPYERPAANCGTANCGTAKQCGSQVPQIAVDGTAQPCGTNRHRAVIEPSVSAATASAPISDTSFEADPEPENGAGAPKVNGHRNGKMKPSELTDHRHADLIEDWCGEFQAFFDSAYVFGGGRDGKAVKELLRVTDPGTVLRTAKKAWAGDAGEFLAEQAATLHGLANKWNEITSTLARKGNGLGVRPGSTWTSEDVLRR